ncbi:MAG TPA: hypothetical protein DIT25_01000 [Candidatus Moranbacteria bacterium]|nr:hypothetical protein [Candidatus Moranbacteria bacterium]
MNKFENPSLYDKEGKVSDPEIAEKMAYAEKPFRERKILGLFKPSQAQIKLGEKIAEKVGMEALEEKKSNLEKEHNEKLGVLFEELRYIAVKLGVDMGRREYRYQYSGEIDGVSFSVTPLFQGFQYIEERKTGSSITLEPVVDLESLKGRVSAETLARQEITIDGRKFSIADLSDEFVDKLINYCKEKTDQYKDEDGLKIIELKKKRAEDLIEQEEKRKLKEQEGIQDKKDRDEILNQLGGKDRLEDAEMLESKRKELSNQIKQ